MPYFFNGTGKNAIKKMGRSSPPHNLLLNTYGLIFTPKLSTTDADGVSVPTVALIVPAVRFAGAVTVLTGTVAAATVAL